MSGYTQGQCPCGKSSDAYTEWDNGSRFCFRCGNSFTPRLSMDQKNRKDQPLNQQYVPWREITQETMKYYGVLTDCSEEGEPQAVRFSYPNGRVLCRSRGDKKFWFEGEKVQDGALFGQDHFAHGSAKAITITEGCIDCLSVFQMLGSKYPVVGITSASTAKSECSKEYDYINSFSKIYVCFDSDEPGQEAAAAVARLFNFNKVRIVRLRYKDPNEYLQNQDSEAFVKDWWAAQKFLPEGIVSGYDAFDKIIDEDQDRPSVPWPFDRLQQMTYGIRTGEFVLLTAQEGIGKTEILRSVEYHLLKSTKDNIGIIHLEENKARTLKGLVGYHVQRPIHLPDFSIPKDEIKSGLRELTGHDDRVHLYSHFGSDDPDIILSTIRFMAGACGCRYIFLDHITMVVSGTQGEDERRALDYISTRGAMMVEELDFCLFCVSHVNDEGKTRGSRNISKVADLRIDLTRDLDSESEEARNSTYLRISKNRYAGKTGPAGVLKFDPETWVLTEDFGAF